MPNGWRKIKSLARSASSTSGGSFSTENCVKFVVLFNIADGFPCFMADVGHSGQILSYAFSAWSCVGNDMPCLLCC